MQRLVEKKNEKILRDMEPFQIRQIPSDKINCVVGCEGDLGAGSFGTVRIGFLSGCEAVAVKCITFRGAEKVKGKFGKRIRKEIEILHQTNHENIVRVYGWTHWTNAVAIVMELLLGGSLWDLLIDDDVELSMLLRLRMCAEISSGIAFAHNLPDGRIVVHGDIKSENILLTEYLHCKIADFGSAKLSSSTNKNSTTESQRESNQFTQLYAAPELHENPSCTLKPFHDVYSFSIVIFEILSRRKPVETDAMISIYVQSVLQNDHRPCMDSILETIANSDDDDDVKVISELINIMQRCWKRNPLKRPSMASVKEKLSEITVQFDAAVISKHATNALDEMDVMKAPLPKQYECKPIHKFIGPIFNNTEDSSAGSSSFANSPGSNSSRSTSSRYSLSRFRNSFSSSATGSSINSAIFDFSPTSVEYSTEYMGGLIAFNEWRNKVYVYDVKTHALRTKANLNHKHYGGTLVNYNGSCYVISGFNMRHVERSDLNDMDAPWSEIARTNQTRWQAASTVCRDWIYTVGGYGKRFQSSKSSGERYNYVLDQWKTIKNMKKARSGHALVSMRGLVFAIGGEGVNSAECYDPREGSWSEIPSMKCKRGGVAAVVLHDELYAIGGYKNADLVSVEKYNPFTTKWQMIAELNVVRRYHGACTLDGKIYVAGGGSGVKFIDSAEIYYPRKNVWRTEPAVDEFRDGLKIVPI